MMERLPPLLEQVTALVQSVEPARFPAELVRLLADTLEAAVVALFEQHAPDSLLIASAGTDAWRPDGGTTFPSAPNRTWERVPLASYLLVVGWDPDGKSTAARQLLMAAKPALELAISQLHVSLEARRAAHDHVFTELRTLIIDGELELPTLLQRILQLTSEICRTDEVYLFGYGDPTEQGGLSLRAAIRTSPSPDSALRLSRALALGARSIRQRALLEEGSEGRLVALPLFGGSKPMGAMVLLRQPQARNLQEPFDLQRMRVFADYATMAIQSAVLLSEQHRRVRELVLLNEVARDCAQLGLDRLLPAVCERLCRSLNIDITTMFFTDAERQELVWGGGFSSFLALPTARPRMPLSLSGLAGRTLQLRQARRSGVEEIETREMRSFVAEHGLTHFGAVPLLVKDRGIGVMVAGRRGRPITDEEMRLLVATCAEIAVALDNSLLYSEIQGRAHDLALLQRMSETVARSLDPQVVLHETCQRLVESLGCDAARVYVERNKEFEAIYDLGLPQAEARKRARVPLTDPVTAPALAGSEPVELDPEALNEPSRSFLMNLGLKRLLAAPLITADEWDSERAVSHIGVLVLARKAARRFSSSERRMLAAVAAQLAVALRNAQLYEQTRQRAEDLAIVADAGRALLGGAALADALYPVTERVTRLLRVQGCAIMLADKEAKVLRNQATFPLAEGTAQVAIPLSEENTLTRAMRLRTVQSNRNLVGNAIVARFRGAPFVPVWSTAVPLVVGDDALGVMIISDSDPQRLLTELEIHRVAEIAQQVAVGIDRAQLNARLEKSLKDLAQAQAQLVRRERLAALGELAALVAHEVRNPLGVIVNSLGSLAKFADLTGDARRIYEIMQAEANRLDRIVSDMLDYTRPTEPRLVPGSLLRVLRDAVMSATASERARGTPVDAVQTSVTVAPEVPPVPMDDRLLHQALVNLLSNAFQSLGKGGQIELGGGVSADGRFAEIVVSDNGPGMTDEVKTRLFEPFFTTKAKGSGLGLAMVKRIVDGHGGDITVESKPGGGTRFIVRLPLARAEAPAASAAL